MAYNLSCSHHEIGAKLSPFQPVSYIKYMIIVCLTNLFSILSPFQKVNYSCKTDVGGVNDKKRQEG